MIPYRRQLAIDAGALNLVAADVTVGDVILIRRPGATERTAETVTGVEYIAGTSMFRIHFHGMPPCEVSRDMPVGIESFTTGGWRQYVP